MKLKRYLDIVAMGSPLGSILADIIMVKLKNNLVPNLHQHLEMETICSDNLEYFRGSKMDHVLLILNYFQRNMKFTYEKKNNNRLLLLVVLFVGNFDEINTTTYRKSTSKSIYTCYLKKRGTVCSLMKRTYTICFKDHSF